MHLPRTLRVLENTEQELGKKLRTEAAISSKKISRLVARVSIGLISGLVTYAIAYAWLNKQAPATSQPPAPVAKSTPPKSTTDRLLHGFLWLILGKSPYPGLRVFLPKGANKRGLSLLVTMLPWCVRLLSDAYGRRKSQTSP